MKIFINCSNLTSGGGLSVGLGVVNALFTINSDDFFVIFVPEINEYSNFKSNSKVKVIRNSNKSFLSKLLLEWGIAKMAKREKCDSILSLTNYAIPSNLPQSLLLHWPYAVYPESEIWGKMTFLNKLRRKFRLFKLRYLLPNSNQLIVQTEVMKKRAQSYLVPKKKIYVIPSSVGFLGDDINLNILSKIERLKANGNKVFLCINEYYEHKNLEILIPLAKVVKNKNIKIKFIVTLNNVDFLNKIKGLEDVIVNVGRVNRTETKFLFQSCNALFFPSLIESFGIPLIEAQEVGLSIYTSDRDFAKAVCGDNAIYFDPHSVEDILTKIQTNQSNYFKKVNSDWNTITLNLIDTLK